MKLLAQLFSYLLVATMFLPLRLLASELKRSNCWKDYLQYQNASRKVDRSSLRIKFLENCKRADLIPSFLKFTIPNKGCFDGKSVHEFQRQLLSKEVVRVKNYLKNQNTSLDGKRDKLKRIAPTKCLPSIVPHTQGEK